MSVFENAGAFVITGFGNFVAVSGLFPAIFGLPVRNQRHRLPDGAETIVGIQLDAVNVVIVAASPVEIHPSVLVQEEVGVVNRHFGTVRVRVQMVRHQLPAARILRIGRLVQMVDVGSHPVKLILIHHGGGRIQLRRKLTVDGDILPMLHVIRTPIALAFGCEEVIAVLIDFHYGIGRFARTGSLRTGKGCHHPLQGRLTLLLRQLVQKRLRYHFHDGLPRRSHIESIIQVDGVGDHPAGVHSPPTGGEESEHRTEHV